MLMMKNMAKNKASEEEIKQKKTTKFNEKGRKS